MKTIQDILDEFDREWYKSPRYPHFSNALDEKDLKDFIKKFIQSSFEEYRDESLGEIEKWAKSILNVKGGLNPFQVPVLENLLWKINLLKGE
jgi:hypothetical protein